MAVHRQSMISDGLYNLNGKMGGCSKICLDPSVESMPRPFGPRGKSHLGATRQDKTRMLGQGSDKGRTRVGQGSTICPLVWSLVLHNLCVEGIPGLQDTPSAEKILYPADNQLSRNSFAFMCNQRPPSKPRQHPCYCRQSHTNSKGSCILAVLNIFSNKLGRS